MASALAGQAAAKRARPKARSSTAARCGNPKKQVPGRSQSPDRTVLITGETMTFAYWMLIVAVMMPYLTIALAKLGGGIDNRAPRPALEHLSGWRQRADWAHRNHFEAFPAFAAAVFVAELSHAPQNRIDQVAGIFVLLRVIYTALYLADQATLRSVFWFLGLVAVVWLFVLGV
jgi:uncharacterized MAPEG superfamily protein